MSQGRDRMWVQLEFEAGGDRYRVARETRKTGQRPIRLERCQNDEWVPLQGGARDVTAAIEKIVGLDFDGFTRSVLLPQGQFQEFLAGDPQKRREVLAGLLQLDIYEGVRRRAGERTGDLQAQLRARQEMLDSAFAGVSEEAIKETNHQPKGL